MSQRNRLGLTTLGIAVFTLSLGVHTASAQEASGVADEAIELDIEAQPISDALNALAQQSGLQVVFFSEVAGDLEAPAAVGDFESSEAALQYLLADTGLDYRFVNDRTVAIQSIASEEEEVSEPGKSQPASSQVLMAQNQTSATQDQTSNRSEITNEDEVGVTRIDEIVVTGSHIRGAAPTGSPLIVIDRVMIEQAGIATVRDLLTNIPQNFGGDASAELISTSVAINTSGGTGANLRGLGTSATLTLVNGRRLSQAGGLVGEFVDISSIPLTAIERVEILPDGASAIYGSDAVAGVINFVLRKKYEGAESRIRIGSVTDGGQDTYQFGQTFGKSWGTGNALFAYEFYKQGNLGREERSLTANSDKREFGGDDFRRLPSNPGNIIAPILAAIPSGQDGTNLQSGPTGDLLIGQRNLFNDNRGWDLLRSEERHNVFVTARQEVSERAELFGEFYFSERDYVGRFGGQELIIDVTDAHPFFVTPDIAATSVSVNYNFVEDLGPLVHPGDVTNYSGTLGTTLDFAAGWEAELYGSYAQEQSFRSDLRVDTGRLAEALGSADADPLFDPAVDGYFNPFADGSNTPQNVLDYINTGGFLFDAEGEVWSVNAKADGSLFEIPGGAVKLAIGGQYREERYTKLLTEFTMGQSAVIDSNSPDNDRTISSVFAEVLLPIVGERNGRPGMRRLELSAAVRHEDYSDFGTTTDPKFGVVWSPVEGLEFRSSWGTSFKAPNLSDLIPTGQFFFTFDIPNPTPTDPARQSNVFALLGSNPELGPETSTTWTAGFDISPPALRGLGIHVTYFDIEYDNRIGTIPDSFFFAFLNPTLFAPVTTLNPDPSRVQSLFDSPYFFGGFGAGPVEAIIDTRVTNVAVTNMSGLDVTLSYDTETPIGSLSFDLNGSYIFELENAITATAPITDVVNTVNQPVDLRVRGSASWSNGGYGASLIVNHIDGYKDTNFDPARTVASWTTTDLTLRYDTSQNRTDGWAKDIVFSLIARNLFDADAPFVNSGLGYDPANATVRGRSIALDITKKW